MSIEYADLTLITKPKEKLVYLTLLTMLTTYQMNKINLSKPCILEKTCENQSLLKQNKNPKIIKKKDNISDQS